MTGSVRPEHQQLVPSLHHRVARRVELHPPARPADPDHDDPVAPQQVCLDDLPVRERRRGADLDPLHRQLQVLRVGRQRDEVDDGRVERRRWARPSQPSAGEPAHQE